MACAPRVSFISMFLLVCIATGAHAVENVEVRVVSSRPDAVSGGTALVQVDAPSQSIWSIYLNNRDITASVHRSERSGKHLALLDRLSIGKNTLEVRINGKRKARTQILNHPLNGPIFSGPHQQPFICQTEANGLGRALDANCSAKTLVQYYYKSTKPQEISDRDRFIAEYDARSKPGTLPLGFKLYDPEGQRPSDIALVTLPDGRTVNYIVRRELGVINRAVYEIQFLHEPGTALPDPWSAPHPGWNGRLVYAFGGGCGPGYRQGVLPGYGVVSGTERKDVEALLTQGYAFVTSSLNVMANTCNDKVSAETASMVKEYFVKRYGEPTSTIGIGASGGAVAVQLIAQNYPGILDGVIPSMSGPDMITGIPVYADCALLQHAFEESDHAWTEVQKTAVSGYATWQTCKAAARMLTSYGWLNPKACDSSLPAELIYDPVSNPGGVRCTFYDNEAIVFGRDPKTGFAWRALDNVGVQYGLAAFDAGQIDAERFVELNERMGGYDRNGQIDRTRTVADPKAVRAAYRYGPVLAGKSLTNTPIIDWKQYTDDAGDTHTTDRPLMTRARLIAAGGDASNHVILVTPRPPLKLDTDVGLHVLVPWIDRWLTDIAADQTDIPRPQKIARNRPMELADGCIAVDGERIAEVAAYMGPGRCNQIYPLHGNPRAAAGAPMARDILKCVLKELAPSDYTQLLTPDQLARLKDAFPGGVCDYSKPGVGQSTQPEIWHRYGDHSKGKG